MGNFDVDLSVSSVNRLSEGRAPFVKRRMEDAFTSMWGDREMAMKYVPPLEHFQAPITINIFFTTISQTVLEREEKISVFDLISNIGGQLGSIIMCCKNTF